MKNIFSLLASRLLIPFFSTLLVFFMARSLGKEGIGLYAVVMALGTLAMGLATVGVRNIIIRDVGENNNIAGDYLLNASLLVSAIAIVSYLLLIVYVYFSRLENEVSLGIVIVGVSLLPYSIAFVYESILIALSKNVIILKGSLIQHIFRIVFSVAALMSGRGIYWVFAIFTTSNFLLLYFYIMSSRKLLPLCKINIRIIREKFLKNMPLFSSLDIVATIYSKLGVLVLSNMVVVSAVGLYSAGITLNQIIALVASNIALAKFPLMAAKRDETFQLKKITEESVRHVLLIVVPIVTFSFIYANEIVTILYGRDFAESAVVFRIVLTGIIPLSISLTCSYLLLGTGLQREEFFIVLASTCMAAVLYAVLIAQFSIIGAAVANVLAVLFKLIMQTIYIQRRFFSIINVLDLIKLGVIISILVLFCSIVNRFDIHIFVLLVPFFLVYMILTYTFKMFTKQELKIVKNGISRHICVYNK